MRAAETHSIFRTRAWGDAWLETWGKDPGLVLFDLGGRRNPREMLYRVKSSIKGIIPIERLHLVGVGSQEISTPRAEYNDIQGLIRVAGSLSALLNEIKAIGWSQWYLSDIYTDDEMIKQFKQELHLQNWLCQLLTSESAYYVNALNIDLYVQQLGRNTRLAYFNRRERLLDKGSIEFRLFDIDKARDFFGLLNNFHCQRWGVPCYSDKSQAFLINFMQGLAREGGRAIMEVMLVKGEICSVIFDMIFSGCRYNFQSGYVENRFPKIALGAIHMGYAIESAIADGIIYDFMAGRGKHTNYKARIATHEIPIQTLSLERGWTKWLRKLQQLSI